MPCARLPIDVHTRPPRPRLARSLAAIKESVSMSRPNRSGQQAENLLVPVITALEDQIGNRALLAMALCCSRSRVIAEVVAVLQQSPGRSLSEICDEAGGTVHELLLAYQDGVRTYARTMAVASVAKHLPAIVDDVLTRARTHDEPCTACDGAGTIPPGQRGRTSAPEECRLCHGTGRVQVLGEIKYQRLAFELAGLL
jgi:hypothetical protein